MENQEQAHQLIAKERQERTGILDLGNLGLTELPAELFELTHLRVLNLGSWYFGIDGTHVSSDRGRGRHAERNALIVLPDLQRQDGEFDDCDLEAVAGGGDGDPPTW